MLLKISKVIAASVLFAVPIAAAPEKLDYVRILHNGCSIEQLDGKVRRAYVWADYQEGPRSTIFPYGCRNAATGGKRSRTVTTG